MRILFLSLALVLIVICASGAVREGGGGRREIVIDYTDAAVCDIGSAALDALPYPSLSEAGFTLPESVELICSDGSVREVGFEDYITGVAAAEMPCDFHAEALKAQAVAARSYALYKLGSRDNVHGGGKLCSDFGCCAAYYSREEARTLFGPEAADKMFAAAEAAVNATRGVVMLCDEAAVCAVFHSSSDGVTESSEAVWGGELGYLTPVSTPEQARLSVKAFTYSEVAQKLASEGIYINEEARIYSEKPESGRTSSLVAGDTIIKGTEARKIFSLASSDFDAEYNGGVLTFYIHGCGHGVGMSQYGANTMAENGSGFEEILTHYYSGVKLYMQE